MSYCMPHNDYGTPFNVFEKYNSLQRLTNIVRLGKFLIFSSNLLYKATDLNKKLDLYTLLVTFGKFGMALFRVRYLCSLPSLHS